MKINLIVAIDSELGFSKNDKIPWINEPFAKDDLKRFRKITMGHTVIMGRKTYEDIAQFSKVSPILPGRDCIVLSRSPKYFISNDILVYTDIDHALENCDPDKDVFFIGGYSIFEEAFKRDLNTLYMTSINNDYKCDKFFPVHLLDKRYKLVNFTEFEDLSYLQYDRIRE